MTWFYQNNPFEYPQDNWGFVYIITNKLNNKKYIGKKQFWFKKYKQVKGKRKSYLAESDWKDYYGSNDILNEEVKLNGHENYHREILMLCVSKSLCSYYEAKYQFEYDVILHPEEFYNAWVSVKVTRKHLQKYIKNA